jgi:hypothetical protein
MELFGNPPTLPHPFLQDLDDLPPRSTNPPQMPSFGSIERMENKTRAFFEPNDSFE